MFTRTTLDHGACVTSIAARESRTPTPGGDVCADAPEQATNSAMSAHAIQFTIITRRIARSSPLRPATRRVLRLWQRCLTSATMKTITVRLPDPLVAELEEEARERRVSKSDVVRERLTGQSRPPSRSPASVIADLIGSVDGLPRDLSASRKQYLKKTGYGRRHPR